MKNGLVLEGGAKRGMFTAGILDAVMELGIKFPYVVGVSAGAGNSLNFVAEQRGRTKYTILPDKRDEYIGMREVLKSGRFINLDRMLTEFAYNQYPFDFKTYFSSDCENELAAVNCETGETEYLSERSDEKRLMLLAKASCSVPMLCSPVEIDGYHYLDGSIGDSIPFMRALQKGCDRALVILTRPEGEQSTDYKKYKAILTVLYKRKYPKLFDAFMSRIDRYNKQLEDMAKLEAEGRLLVIRPTEMSLSRFESDREKLLDFYDYGLKVAAERLDEIIEFLA